MAEIEWSVYGRCLQKHVPDDIILTREVEAVTKERNQNNSAINWQFRADGARIKLKQLYPSIPE